MPVSQKQLDNMLAEIVKSRADRGPEPDMERIWAGISARLRRERRSARWVKAVAAVAVMLLAATAFVPQVQAFGLRVWRSFKVIILDSSTGQIQSEYEGGSSTPNTLSETPQEREYLDFEKAQEGLPFAIKRPGYLPEGYRLEKIKRADYGHGFFKVSQYYSRGNDYLLLTQENCLEENRQGVMYDTDDTTVREIKVRDLPAMLLVREKDGWASVLWNEGALTCRIAGIATPEEIVKTAESLNKTFSNVR